MTDTRFNWNRASKLDACFELRKRNISRELYADSDLLCVACGRKPKRKEIVYYPAQSVSATNKTIGHKNCVDRECEQQKAKTAPERQKEKTHIVLTDTQAAPAKPSHISQTDLATLERLQGWQEGVKFALEQNGKYSREWIDGWKEGLKYASDHKDA